MFETRSQAWQEVGLLRQISPRVVKRARLEALVLVPLFVGVVVLYDNRVEPARHDDARPPRPPGAQGPRTGARNARDGGDGDRAGDPRLGDRARRRPRPRAGAVPAPGPGDGGHGRLPDPPRHVVAGAARRAAAWPASKRSTLALGGAFTAVIFGLAAQQTLGNLIAGTVLLSARPFRVGERVRLQGGPLAGQIEGTVSSLGLLYTTFATGDDSIMVPNSVVLNVAVLPLREPEAVNLRARLRAGMTPGDLQEILEKSLQTPLRDAPRITLEELDGDEVVVRIAATPRVAAEGRQLASELLSIVSRETRSRARRRRSAGTAYESLSRTPDAARARPAASSSAPARIRSASPPAGSPPASIGESVRKQLVDEPRGEQLAREVRAALAQQRCARRSARAARASAAAQVEPPVALGAHVLDLRRAAAAGSPAEGVSTITTRAAGSASSGMSSLERQAPGDDARERLLAAGPARGARRRRDSSGMIRP